jgi:hypothetical protein
MTRCARRRVAHIALAGLAMAGCSDPPAPERTAPAAVAADAAPGRPPPGVRLVDDANLDAVDGTPVLPAWSAVAARSQMLARRGATGAVTGRLGGDAAPGLRWLIDETEGAGALAIRAALPADGGWIPVGARVVLVGAWEVDEHRRWQLAARSVLVLGGAPPAAEPALQPGLRVEQADAAPAGALPPSQLAGIGDLLFSVVAPPAKPGDGWEITDVAAAEPRPARRAARAPVAPVARLLLPGERAAYGGQDMLAPDEVWPLERGAVYVVRASRVAPARKGELPLHRALSVPRRIPEPPPPATAPAR